jgi:hypothetical protein
MLALFAADRRDLEKSGRRKAAAGGQSKRKFTIKAA